MYDACSGGGCSEENPGAAVIGSCYSPAVLQSSEHDLDPVAAFFATFVSIDALLVLCTTGRAGT